VSLTRALGTENLRGSVSYTIEDVGIKLNDGWHDNEYRFPKGSYPNGTPPNPDIPANVPHSILDETGFSLLNRFGSSLAYDTRGAGRLPDRGQRTELSGELVQGDREFYKLDLRSSWYFRGFHPRHVLELVGHAGVADGVGGGYVPFYDRYYLGGLHDLRGYKYRSVSPREDGFNEPVGGDTTWFGSAEYSVPIFEQDKEKGIGVRFAVFYDIGNVAANAYDFKFSDFDDDYGVGLRLNLPIGPLRLDYGIPIHHDKDNGSSGRFQFGVGYTRDF
jgi:outer membrane protein insertion porin family